MGIAGQQFVLGMNADLPRLPGQHHAGFLRRTITLLVVAGEAAGYQVLPCREPASRSRNHVIECQASRRQAGTAVLAGTAVAQQDPLAGNGPVLPRHAPVLHQSYYAWHRNVELRGPDSVARDLFNNGGALEDERQRAPCAGDVDRFVAGVDDEAQTVQGHNALRWVPWRSKPDHPT